MIVYHVTTPERAKKIQKQGFKDGSGFYGVINSVANKRKISKGVFISDAILGANEGLVIEEPAIFILDIPEEEIKNYEWIEENKGYREWCIPAHIINKYFVKRNYYKEEDFYDGKYPATRLRK